MEKKPSQLAKEYAADNGFVIAPLGAKYTVCHTPTGTTFVRSNYPAVLNEMKAIACQYASRTETERASDDDIFLTVDEVVNHPAFRDMPNTRAVLQQQIESETLMPPRKMTTEELDAVKDRDINSLYGRVMPPVTISGEALDKIAAIQPMTREQAREVAHRIGRGLKEPMILLFNVDKSRGGKWYVFFNGRAVTFAGYASRADALKVIRQGMNGTHAANWRKARVTIEFAWSI
jgi:hypothetical protein